MSTSKELDKSAFQPIDLVGKVIIKVQLGDDIRKVLIHNESITYDELLLMMQRIFNGKLTANDDLTIKYKDEDGDLVTVFDSQDLSFALQTSRVLKLQVFMNSNEDRIKPKLNADDFKKQLREIRNAVTWLLDSIEVSNEGPNDNMPNAIQQEPLNNPTPSEVPTDNGVTKEFDPLRNSKEERSKTPQTPQQVKTESSLENIAVSQPQRQTPPVQQQSQIPQNMYNGQSQGTMNQHNTYSGGQLPPQGPQGKWVNPYPQPAMRASYPTAQYSYLYSTQIPASGYSQITTQMKPPTGNPPVHSMYYPTNTTPNPQYSATQYPGQ